MAKNVTIGNKTYIGINKIKIRIPNTETYHEFLTTDDATATPSDIVVGKTAYVQNQKVIGQYKGEEKPGWEDVTGYNVTVVDNGGNFDLEFILTDGTRPKGTFSDIIIENVYFIKLNNFSYKHAEEQLIDIQGTTLSDLQNGLFLENDITLTINSDEGYYNVTVNIEGDGSCSIDGEGAYKPGDEVTLYALTYGSSEFGRWENEEGQVLSYSSTYTFTMPSNDVTIIAYIIDAPCLVEGTLITLSDYTQKPIEDITYSDNLLVWDFDNSCFSSSKPIWIQEVNQIDKYNHLTFSDGSELNTVHQHRIFNVEKGMFTYPMTDDTPIGTTTYNDRGQFVQLISKEVIEKEVNYYNIITEYHMNLFAGTILTSCRLSNLYPIENMTYVKDSRQLHDEEVFSELDNKWVKGLRLLEQPLDINRDNADVHDATLVEYVKRLERSMLK